MQCAICERVIPEDAPSYTKSSGGELVDYIEGDAHDGLICHSCYEAALTCEGCSGIFTADDGREDNTDAEFWCHECYSEKFSACTYCDREVWIDDTFYHDGYVCDSCNDEHCFSCNGCGENTHNDDGYRTVDGTVCFDCYDNHYNSCECGDAVADSDWCGSCGSCTDCCSCVPQAEQNRPIRSTTAGGPALIQTLDNSAFILRDENIEAVLGMLDKSKKITVGDVTGRYCTADSSYFKLERVVAEVGKVSNPKYLYGVRSNKYDVILSCSTPDITSALTRLGLTYHLHGGDKHKVGLSFRVRKRKYDACITFLKFLCAQ